jgi:hypothetical protein
MISSIGECSLYMELDLVFLINLEVLDFGKTVLQWKLKSLKIEKIELKPRYFPPLQHQC